MVLRSLAACRKGSSPRPTSFSIVGDGLVQRVDLAQVQLEHEAVMRADRPRRASSSSARLALTRRCTQTARRSGSVSPVDERLQHRAPLLPRMSAEHDADLEVGILEHLLDALDVRGPLAHELLAGARERPQLLHGHRRHEAGADQAVGQQIGQPHRVVDIGLAPGHVLDVRGVGQHQLEVPFQHVPHRLPVHAGGLHRHVLDPEGVEPVGQAPAGPTWSWQRCALPATARRRRRCARTPPPSACAHPIPRSADR